MLKSFFKEHYMIALTLGDPAGIGPEIILKALKSFNTDDFIIYGWKRQTGHSVLTLFSMP